MTQPTGNPRDDALRGELLAMLGDANRNEFRGLKVDDATVLRSVVEGERRVVWWQLVGQHAGDGDFLGWAPTERDVRLEVLSIEVTKTDPDYHRSEDDFVGWRHVYDKLSALAQIGVKAVGRPVLR